MPQLPATRDRLRIVLLVALLATAGACHHKALGAAAAPVTANEEPCWWAVFRSPLPLDTVSAHLASAFTTLGLTGATSAKQADTAWAQAGPTRLDARTGATYSARMVAFRRGDSTLYRYFVEASPPPGGWGPSRDSLTADHRHVSLNPAGDVIGFCQDIARVSANHGTSPSAPDGEEALTVWRRRR